MEQNNNKNCKIVRDLLPSYMENLLSNESKLFVDEHIDSCSECKKYLDTISKDIINEKNTEEDIDNLNIDYLKKYRKKLSSLKKILLIIIILIILIIVMVFAKCIYYHNILTSTSERITELENSENFLIRRKEISIDYKNNTTDESFSEIYYKDGKYKRVGSWFVMYGEINSTEYLEIFHETKSVENIRSNYIPYRKKDLISLYSHINTYQNLNSNLKKMYVLNTISIRTEKYNDKNCYAIKIGASDSGYNEFWIDKESGFMFRQVSEYYGLYYRENIYTVTFNQVQDEDVEIDNLEQYSDYTHKNVTVTDNIVKEWREKYN